MSRPELIICQGLPHSGKRTFAFQRVAEGSGPLPWVRINLYEAERMLHEKRSVGIRKALTRQVRNAMITLALQEGFSVVNDDPNLDAQDVKELAAVAENVGAEVTLKTFPLSLEEALYRNERSLHPLPAHVVVEMARKANAPRPVRPERPWVDGARWALICDGAGTFYRNDEIHDPVMRVLRGLVRELGGRVEVFLLAGDDNERINLLHDGDTHLGMMTESPRWTVVQYNLGTGGPEAPAKRTWYEQAIVGRYNVALVLDDKDRPVRMWRELGLPVCQIAEGE